MDHRHAALPLLGSAITEETRPADKTVPLHGRAARIGGGWAEKWIPFFKYLICDLANYDDVSFGISLWLILKFVALTVHFSVNVKISIIKTIEIAHKI